MTMAEQINREWDTLGHAGLCPIFTLHKVFSSGHVVKPDNLPMRPPFAR